MEALKAIMMLTLTVLVSVSLARAQEEIDYEMADKFRDEGFNRSQVMDIASYMTDVYGPRLSNSPSYNRSARWATDKFREYGISAEMQAYGQLGTGWENRYTSVHMHKPEYQPVIAYPLPWTRSTNGKVISNVVYINTQEIYSERDLDQYRGKLRNKIVFTMPKRKLKLQFSPLAVRLSEEELEGMAKLHVVPEENTVSISQDEYRRLQQGSVKEPFLRNKLNEFFELEGAAVLVSPGREGTGPFDKGVVFVPGGRPLPLDAPRPIPELFMSAEHYNRVIRVLEKNIDVEMEVEIDNYYEEEDLNDYNVIAEIQGTDLRDEFVMIGGHYDAKPAGTGATDNASGAAAVMEAMRILKETGAQPRRTIRAALWGSEEIGHHGSSAYVEQNFGGPDIANRLPEHDKLSVYFNMDWYGRFRGVFLQGNDLVRPIFEEWMKPFHDVGMAYLVPGNTGGSDHLDFIQAGLPGFQFIQDDLEFFTTNWHTNMDVYDRLVEEDLMQASVILASWAYFAAMRDEMIPRSERQMKNNRRWHK